MVLVFEISKPVPSDKLPPARPYPKPTHQLENKYSNGREYGRYFSFKPPYTFEPILIPLIVLFPLCLVTLAIPRTPILLRCLVFDKFRCFV